MDNFLKKTFGYFQASFCFWIYNNVFYLNKIQKDFISLLKKASLLIFLFVAWWMRLLLEFIYNKMFRYSRLLIVIFKTMIQSHYSNLLKQKNRVFLVYVKKFKFVDIQAHKKFLSVYVFPKNKILV